MTRPLLIPGLPRVWRSSSELQLGADPSRAVSVQLPDPRTAQVLDLLDGTRSERAVLARVVELGISADQARALIATLRTAGLVRPATDLIPSGLPHETRRRLTGEASALALTGLPGGPAPAEILRRRWNSRVVLNGHGRLGAPIAVALAEAGVGQVQAEATGVVGPGELPGGPLRGADLGRPRRSAISDAVRRAAPGTQSAAVRQPPATPIAELAHDEPPTLLARTSPAGRQPAANPIAEPLALNRAAGRRPAANPIAESDRPLALNPLADRRPAANLVVELDHDEPPDLLAEARAADREPLLAVTIREGVPVIGPLVPAVGGPCRHCLELHRRDRDATWPGPVSRPPTGAAEPCTVATLLAATAYAIAEVLAHLDGGVPQTAGAAVEITTPGRLRRRSWPPHPACPCTTAT